MAVGEPESHCPTAQPSFDFRHFVSVLFLLRTISRTPVRLRQGSASLETEPVGIKPFVDVSHFVGLLEDEWRGGRSGSVLSMGSGQRIFLRFCIRGSCALSRGLTPDGRFRYKLIFVSGFFPRRGQLGQDCFASRRHELRVR